MIFFDDNELEVALVTYNRDKFVEEWLEKCGEGLLRRNVSVIVYDSSTNSLTKDLIDKLNFSLKGLKRIKYEYISADLSVGHVVAEAIYRSNCEYIWVVGDSRCHRFDELDKKVFPLIKEGYEHIVLRTVGGEENDGRIFLDRNEMLRECFISMTCTGFYIYKKSIYEPVVKESRLEACKSKYDDNYGFTWMGPFLEAYALSNEYRTVFTDVEVVEIEPQKKVRRWSSRFFKCWCEDICELIDGLSDLYDIDDSLIKKTWKMLGFDTAKSLYTNYKERVLTKEVYEKYESLFARASSKIDKIHAFAYADDDCIEDIYQQWIECEAEEYKEKALRAVNTILKNSQGNDICIYGAGKGGMIVKSVLENNGAKIKCFYDRNAKTIRCIDSIPVKLLEESCCVNDYIIISLMGDYSTLKRKLCDRGASYERIYYVEFEE